MNKKNLLSIGELSKITGVHIKALRYYDSLGILTPVFVDPDSGYRYYSFEQKAIVEAIQFCVDLNIPLKQFSNYINDAAPWISYTELIQQGEEIMREKARIMQERLARLKAMRVEIERSEISCQSSEPKEYTLPARNCWIVPYTGKLICEESRQLTRKLIIEIYKHGLSLGNSTGIMLLRKEGNWQQFLFLDIVLPENEADPYPEIIHIPSGRYLCKKVEHSSIDDVWNWCLAYTRKEQIQLVIETELFIGNYYFSDPVLEQRCLLFE